MSGSVLRPRVHTDRPEPGRVHLLHPNPAQWAAGARWFRCDGALLTLKSLAQIPQNYISYARTSTGIAAYRRCLTSTHVLTSCTLRHTLKIHTYVILGTESMQYPGTSATLAHALTLCQHALGTVPVAYGTYPLAAAWAMGDRIAGCYVSG